MKKIIIFIALFYFVKSNQDLSDLIENGEIVKVRGYYESPDSDIFLKNDPLISRPAKFVDYAQSLKSVSNDWNVTELKKNMALSVCYGNLTLFIKDDKIQTETNLYKFLSQIEEYASQTITKFDMPLFIREELILPSILGCEYLKYRFVDVKLNFYMNFENYSPFEANDLDQLICMLKGNFSSVLLRPEEYEKFLSNQNSKDELKKVKHSIGEIEKGQCFFIPSKSYYAIKTDEAWFYSISWIPATDPVNETDCYLSDNKNTQIKLSSLAFKKDFNRQNRETKTGFVSYFLFYLDSNNGNGINKDDFIEKVKKDTTIMNSIQICDNQCPFILSKLFKDLDTDQDNLFSLRDIFNLDYDSALELNKKIEKHVQELGQSLLGQIENLKKTFTQLKNLADEHGMADKVMEMLKEKLKDWKNNLSEEEQNKLGEIELDTILEKLFSFDNSNFEKDERSKRRDEARKIAKEKATKSETDENENQSYREIDENDESEIYADEEDNTTKEEL